MAKAWADNFNRANGNLAGSTLSGGGATWTEVSGTGWQILSNRASTGTLPDGAAQVALVDTDADSDDLYVQVTKATFTRPGSSSLAIRLYLGCNATLTQGYLMRWAYEPGFLEFYIRDLYNVANVVYNNSVDLSSASVIKFQRVGNVFDVLADGVSVMTPVSDTGSPSGAGNRRVGFGASWDAIGASPPAVVEFDDFLGGDYVVGPSGLPLAIAQYHRRLQGMA